MLFLLKTDKGQERTVLYIPAVSVKSATAFKKKIRLEIQNSYTPEIVSLSKRLNSVIHGWYNYLGKYCSSEAFRKGINYVNLKFVWWLYSFCSKIQKENTVWKVESICKRYKYYIMQIQWRSDYRWCSVLGLCFYLSVAMKWWLWLSKSILIFDNNFEFPS